MVFADDMMLDVGVTLSVHMMLVKWFLFLSPHLVFIKSSAIAAEQSQRHPGFKASSLSEAETVKKRKPQ